MEGSSSFLKEFLFRRQREMKTSEKNKEQKRSLQIAAVRGEGSKGLFKTRSLLRESTKRRVFVRRQSSKLEAEEEGKWPVDREKTRRAGPSITGGCPSESYGEYTGVGGTAKKKALKGFPLFERANRNNRGTFSLTQERMKLAQQIE